MKSKIGKKEMQRKLRISSWLVFSIGIILIIFSNIDNLETIQGILLGIGSFLFIYGISSLIKQHKEYKRKN